MGARSGYHTRPHLGELTARQREVLAQVATGKTNQEIADSLGISFESVKSHVSDILLRLDVSSREEAVDAWRTDNTLARRAKRTVAAFFASSLGKVATAGAITVLVAGAAIFVFASRDSDQARMSSSQANSSPMAVKSTRRWPNFRCSTASPSSNRRAKNSELSRSPTCR